jgi:hypothetical protein
MIQMFRQGDLRTTLEAAIASARRAVDNVPEDEFRSEEAAAVTFRLFQHYKANPVSLVEGAISVQADEANIDRRRLGGIDLGFPEDPPTIRGTRVTFNVPFTGDRSILLLRPSGWNSMFPVAEITESEIRFVYEVRSPEVASTRESFDRDLQLTNQYLAWGHEDVTQFNTRLATTLEESINRRLAMLDAASSGLEALGLPVRRKAAVKVDAHLVRAQQTSTTSSHPSAEGLFDVALSFAGENREYVDEVANHLARAGVKVFYDQFETVALWGADLVEHLQNIYLRQARYCVLFISEYYVRKPWPTHERRSAFARALFAKEEYLLPARFDDTPVPGLQPTLGFVDLRTNSPKKFADLILRKLEQTVKKQ